MAEEKKELKKSPEERMEELNRQLRGYMAQIEALRAEIAAINQAIADLRLAEATLRALKELGKGKEILLPVGATAQVKAKIEGVDEVIMSIGTGISAVMSYDEAIEKIRREITALEALRRTLEEAIAELYNQIEELLERVREVGKEEAQAQ
ncbi:MAG: prefoldin subunit alpha [Aquificae bacterium]|nr:prefoldin subunit alpha [Aquificota bacterium]